MTPHLYRAGLAMLFEWSYTPLQLFGPNLPPENSTVTFKCGCSAYPEPTIYWEWSANPDYGAGWFECEEGVRSRKKQIGKIFYVNSTLTVTTKFNFFGWFYRCTCDTWHTSDMSDSVRLLFRRMHVNSFFFIHGS